MFIDRINDNARVQGIDIARVTSADLSDGMVPVTATPTATPAGVIMASALVGAQVADMGD